MAGAPDAVDRYLTNRNDFSLENGEAAITAARNGQDFSLEPGENKITAARNASGAGGGSGGPAPDWADSFFASLGLPPDVVAQVNQIFTQYSDTNAASQAALGYIRGTPWYAQTYPGIQVGIQKGLVTNEADYRNLLNQQSQIYKQYLGRDVSASEFSANLANGTSNQTLGGQLQGAALAGTYGGDWRYTLGAYDTAPTQAETQALGQEQAGLDTPLGQQIQRRLTLAQQRLTSAFSGSLATAGGSLAAGRLSSPGLNPGGPTTNVAS